MRWRTAHNRRKRPAWRPRWKWYYGEAWRYPTDYIAPARWQCRVGAWRAPLLGKGLVESINESIARSVAEAREKLVIYACSNTSWNNHPDGIVDEQQLRDLAIYGMYITRDGERVDPAGIFVPLEDDE